MLTFNLCSLAGTPGLTVHFCLFLPPGSQIRQVNGLAQPGLLLHPPRGLCHWLSLLSAGGGLTISLDVCCRNGENHPATGVSDIYIGTILDDETKGLLYKIASPTRRFKKYIILEGEGKTGT